MSMSSRLFNRAVLRYKAGYTEDARRILASLLKTDPHNEVAWSWYVHTFDKDSEKKNACDKWLRHNPDSRNARKLYNDLLQGKLQKTNRFHSHKRADLFPAAVIGLVVALVIIIGNVWAGYLWVITPEREQLTAVENQYHTLQSNYEILLGNFNTSRSANDQLQIELADISAKHDNLTKEHTNLQQIYGELLTNYDAQVNEYNHLIEQHTTLQTNYDNLNGQYATLSNDYNNLWSLNNQMQSEISFYRQHAVTPPYITIEDQQIYLAFYTSDGRIKNWPIPFAWLEEAITQGNRLRNNPLNSFLGRLDMYTTNGDYYQVLDFRPYVDPDPFRPWMNELYNELNGDEQRFIYETWYLVAQLTSYSYEITETPRYPLETLLSGGGDCEDTAILFASMIRAAPIASQWDVQLVYMDALNPHAPQAVNHLIVSIQTPNQVYLVETTAKDHMNPWNNQVSGWYYSVN